MNMTPPNPLIELAERCEKLTGPCRETDALIWCALEPSYTHRPSHPEQTPDYTASLDAAMTLEVEKWWLTLDRFLMSDDPTRYSVMQKTWRVWLKRYVGDLAGDAPCYQQALLATGPTPAIALTAGWLRARAASEAIPHGR